MCVELFDGTAQGCDRRRSDAGFAHLSFPHDSPAVFSDLRKQNKIRMADFAAILASFVRAANFGTVVVRATVAAPSANSTNHFAKTFHAIRHMRK